VVDVATKIPLLEFATAAPFFSPTAKPFKTQAWRRPERGQFPYYRFRSVRNFSSRARVIGVFALLKGVVLRFLNHGIIRIDIYRRLPAFRFFDGGFIGVLLGRSHISSFNEIAASRVHFGFFVEANNAVLLP
jgi:hypothetical protein